MLDQMLMTSHTSFTKNTVGAKAHQINYQQRHASLSKALPPPPTPLMKLGINPPIPNPIHLQLKPQPSTIHNHLERKIQIIKLYAPRRSQARKQRARHGAEVGRQRADMHQVARVSPRRLVGFAGDQVVGYDEGLAWAEVARVVEGDGEEGRDCFCLFFGVCWLIR